MTSYPTYMYNASATFGYNIITDLHVNNATLLSRSLMYINVNALKSWATSDKQQNSILLKKEGCYNMMYNILLYSAIYVHTTRYCE